MRTLFLLLLCANALYATWVWYAAEAPSGSAAVARVQPHYPARLELASEYRPAQPQTAVADASPATEPAETAEATEPAATAEAAETAGTAETAQTAESTETAQTAETADATLPAHCVRIGSFSSEGAARAALERLHDQLPYGTLVTVPVVVRSNFWVHIPPRASDEEARAVVVRLAERGIESFVIRDDPALRNGISLGVFRDTASAERHAARFADIGYPVAIHEAVQTRPTFAVQGTLSADMAGVEAVLGQGVAIEQLACPVVAADPVAD